MNVIRRNPLVGINLIRVVTDETRGWQIDNEKRVIV